MLRNRSPLAWLKVLVGASASLVAMLLVWPGVVLGHQLTPFDSPLPLPIYIGGAALAVAMSFVFVILRNAPAPKTEVVSKPRTVARWLRLTLQAIGLIAWVWVAVQSLFVNGSGDADVAALFLWVYGWVALALISALLGPVWSWIDPFSTIHAILSWLAEKAHLSGGESSDYPAGLGKWPAIVGLAAVVWLELVFRVEGGRTLGLFMVGYTFITVAAMSYFGKETWRANGETFSVWFGVLGRLAPYALDGEPEDGQVIRRPYASGLLAEPWTASDLTLIALGTGSIIFDGLSQTQLYATLFGGLFSSNLLRDSVTAAVFLIGLTAIVLLMARRLGVATMGAGLLPVAVGYLVAHYLSFLLVNGQFIVAALNDPLLQGANYLPGNLGFFVPTLPIPTSVLWSIQLAAVVGGHIVGAWAGHAEMARSKGGASVAAQIPLAVLMVALTSLTLWSLGQAVLVVTPTK